MLPQRPRPPSGALPHRSQGVSLIVVMVLLVVIAGLGFAAVQISLMGERSARNDRDYQVAWQGSEAALMDAEFDIRGPNSYGSARMGSFATNNITDFVANCGASGNANVDNFQLSVIPEPSSVLLLGIGASVLGFIRCRRRRAAL